MEGTTLRTLPECSAGPTSKLVKSLGLACKGFFDGTRRIDLAPYGAHPEDHSGPCCEQRSVMQKAPKGAVA
jgi:hypothetical protein